MLAWPAGGPGFDLLRVGQGRERERERGKLADEQDFQGQHSLGPSLEYWWFLQPPTDKL